MEAGFRDGGPILAWLPLGWRAGARVKEVEPMRGQVWCLTILLMVSLMVNTCGKGEPETEIARPEEVSDTQNVR